MFAKPFPTTLKDYAYDFSAIGYEIIFPATSGYFDAMNAGDYFNAKHSLQSIIDNYDGPEKAEMVKIAQEKIDEIILLENSDQGDFEDDDVEIDFNEVDQKDKELFDDEDNQSSDDNPENNEEENEN